MSDVLREAEDTEMERIGCQIISGAPTVHKTTGHVKEKGR